MDLYIQIVTTAAERADLERIGRALVERQLAACVQIDGPIESIYRWNGAVETAAEWRCTIKTRRGLYAAVERAIGELHPYEIPEVLAFEVTVGSQAYLAWIDENTDA
ncbi:MAG: divalent-cation tolerance protein CutA [Vulcanimicrobiaceae bacterium]